MKRLLLVSMVTCALTACDCGTAPNPGGSGGGTSANTGGGAAATGGGSGAGGSAGTGGGGISSAPNPLDPNNAFKDSDCDGLSDEIEFSIVYPGGLKTDPANPDSDGDGIPDGVETGHATSPAASCAAYVGDADPSTRTNPTALDSDADGIDDGMEDANHDGLADADETDATAPDTDRDGLADGDEDANRNGLVDAGETDPRKRDTDGDGIADGLELSVTHTDPLVGDSDGDTCLDGAEDLNRNGLVDPGESDPHNAADCGPAFNPDTDGDGVPDRIEDLNGNSVVDTGEMDPANPDTDGDGLSDGLEDANHNGRYDSGETKALRLDSDCDGVADGVEDANHNGTVDAGETDPRKFDSDGDGVSDGVEGGLVSSAIADPTHCTNVPVDADPTTTTDPTNRDSDGDGIDDGAEDANQNGRVDPGELNPNNPGDGVLPDGGPSPAARVCTVQNLRPVLFTSTGDADISLGLPAEFTETASITVGGSDKGLIGYDPVHEVTFIAWREAARSGATTPTADEAALRPLLDAQGTLSNATTQTFTSWDSLPALQAFYDSAAAGDLKTVTNSIATSLIGTGAGALTGTAGATGPFKLQVEFLHRTNSAVVVIVALTPLANYTGAPLFTMSDTAGGSALAQFGDANAYQCEVFQPTVGKVDFLFAIDDSCSMDVYQQSLADTAVAMKAQLGNAQIDWRIALVTSSYTTNGEPNTNTVRGFTRDIDQFRAWLTAGSGCNNGVCSMVPDAGPACWGSSTDGGCWVNTTGTSTERIVWSAARALNNLTPVSDAGAPELAAKVRPDAQVVVVLLGDADDQSGVNLNNLQTFFTTLNATATRGTGGNAVTATNRIGAMRVHGIICPDGQDCGETQNGTRVNPAVITATGGVRGDIGNSASISNAVTQIMNSTIAAAGHVMQKPPIGTSVKVAMDSVLDGVACNKDDLPRSRVDGFDFDGINRAIAFFGACRPGVSTSQAAVSYRYWIDYTPNPGGTPPPCSTDSSYDPNDPDFCAGNLVCNRATGECECPADCGTSAPPAGKVCDTNKLVCDFVCTSDCGGTCSSFQTCNSTTCGCECKQNATCAPGFRFENSGSVCGCVCDTAALNCGATYQADANSCTCQCAPDCGGTCASGTSCNVSTCQCTGGIN